MTAHLFRARDHWESEAVWRTTDGEPEYVLARDSLPQGEGADALWSIICEQIPEITEPTA